MTKDDVLFGYRLQLFAEAARTSVSAACRTLGVHRSTYYAWKRQVDRHGLEMLRPPGAPAQMPNQLPKMVEERIVSFALAHPGLGPRRVSSELAREKWGGIVERMHKARHSARQRVLDRTGNLKVVQKLLGHASIQTTGDVYADRDIDQLAQTMAEVLEDDDA